MKVFSQAILKGALAPRHLIAGLFLNELDDHIIELKAGDQVIAQYNATGVSVTQILFDADDWIAKNNHG